MYETYMTVVGTLITQVDKRRIHDGTTVVSFRVACNERRFDRVAADWVDGDTLYVSVSCWRRLGENVHTSFVCGDPIMVFGRVFSRSYEKDGRRQWATEMEGLAVGPDLTRSTAVITRTKRGSGTAGPTAAAGTGADDAQGMGAAGTGPEASQEPAPAVAEDAWRSGPLVPAGYDAPTGAFEEARNGRTVALAGPDREAEGGAETRVQVGVEAGVGP